MRKISMLDVAREAGVSKNAVSLALRNDPQIPPATRQRIEGCAARLGYQRNPVVGHLMVQLRAGAPHGYKATLALLNANEDGEAFMRHPTIPTYVRGCRRRAAQQGYGLDEFWLGDPRLNGNKLSRIFHSRGIRGALVVGLMFHNRLPTKFQRIWREYACVVTGVRTHEPALTFACADHHNLALQATENALRMGYRRPALVLDATIDHLIDGRFSAGIHIAQRRLQISRRIKPFYTMAGSAHAQEAAFRAWFEKSRPDVILTLFHTVATWLQRMGLKAPEDVGLIQLEWREDHADWAGMNQHNDRVGEAVVDLVIGMIHHGERGVPDSPRATLISGSWVEGHTVRPHNAVSNRAVAPARPRALTG